MMRFSNEAFLATTSGAGARLYQILRGRAMSEVCESVPAELVRTVAKCDDREGGVCWQSKEKHDMFEAMQENTRKALFGALRKVTPAVLKFDGGE